MSGIANAPANKQRPDGRLREKSDGHIVREVALVRGAEHSAELVRSDHIYVPANERRQRKYIVQVTDSREIVFVSEKLVGSVGAEPPRPTEKELWRADMRRIERRSALSD